MDDIEIIGLFHQRDEKAIAELKAKYDKLCYYIAGNILSYREDIEECINSAYYELWNNIPPDEPSDLKTYLCHTVKNKAMDKYKYNSAEKRNSKFSVSLDELADCIPDYREGNGEEIVLAEAVSHFLREQTELHRKVFVRRYWYGDSIAQIAEYYGINENTVATYLFIVRKKLKEYLKEDGFNYE